MGIPEQTGQEDLPDDLHDVKGLLMTWQGPSNCNIIIQQVQVLSSFVCVTACSMLAVVMVQLPF